MNYPKDLEATLCLPEKPQKVRYALYREGKNPLVVICAYPSQANLTETDSTVTLIAQKSRAWGYDGWAVFAVYPEMAAGLKDLSSFNADICAANVDAIQRYLKAFEINEIWGAWGTCEEEPLKKGLEAVSRMLKEEEISVFYFDKLLKNGHPAPVRRSKLLYNQKDWLNEFGGCGLVYDKHWQTFKQMIKAKNLDSSLDCFLKCPQAMLIKPTSDGGSKVFIFVYDTVHEDFWTRQQGLLNTAFFKLFHRDCKIEVLKPADFLKEMIQMSKKEYDEKLRQSGLKIAYNFDNFTEYETNEKAIKAAQNAHGLLHFYGGHDYGKTHLLQAIGNESLYISPKENVLYLSAKDFAKGNRQYKEIDLLLLDDLQLYKGRTDRLVSIFEALLSRGARIATASTASYSELKNINQNGRDYLRETGRSISVCEPTYEERFSAYAEWSEDSAYDFSLDSLEYMAHFQSDPQLVEEVYDVVKDFARKKTTAIIDLEGTKEALADFWE